MIHCLCGPCSRTCRLRGTRDCRWSWRWRYWRYQIQRIETWPCYDRCCHAKDEWHRGIKSHQSTWYECKSYHVHCSRSGTDGELAIKSGARGYIVKPFQAPKVLEEIGNVLVLNTWSGFSSSTIHSLSGLLLGHAVRWSDIQIVGVASDGLEALEKIRELKPDLITLDIEMPRLDGLSMLERKKRDWQVSKNTGF